jgi:hypothetical protein
MENRNMFRSTLILSLTLVCGGCAQPEQQVDEPNKAILKQLEKDCSASPAVIDSPKIRSMLVDKGLITDDMTEEQIKPIVNDYIDRKIKAIRKCKKP